jgi:hypothetical protein
MSDEGDVLPLFLAPAIVLVLGIGPDEYAHALPVSAQSEGI